jgi:signal transduction histidine kinase
MKTVRQPSIWSIFWARAGRVPLRQKIIGIIVAPLLILGLTIAWWVSNQLSGWLSYLLTEERVEQAMSIGMRGVFIITALAALFGLGIASFLTWFLTRPILDMTSVAKRVKNGDLDVRAPVWANDEIGELGRAFNDMILGLDTSRHELETFNQDLRHRNHELAMLYTLSDMANQSYSQQQVTEHGLKITLENTGASAGMILMLSDRKPAVAASHQLSEAFLDRLTACLPELIAQNKQVLKVEDAFAITDIQNDNHLSHDLVLMCQQLEYKTLLIMPIRVKQKMLGVVVLLYPENVMLTPPQRRLISGICNQLGTALQNSQLWKELRHKEQLRAKLLNKIVSAQEEERRRISRELHDETGQALTSLLIQLKMLEKSTDLQDVKVHVEEMRQRTAQTLQEIRRLAADLRPAALDDLGLISALEDYIYEFSRKMNIAVDFQPNMVEDIRLPHEVEILLYRVIQESLTNTARHAQANRVVVTFTYLNSRIDIQVSDDGIGFNTNEVLNTENRSLGILGMRERIELLGGQFNLTSAPGKGTQVHVELALSASEI